MLYGAPILALACSMSFPFSVQPVQGIITPVKLWKAKHWPKPRSFLNGAGPAKISKNVVFHLKERQSFTDRFGCPTPQPQMIPPPQTQNTPTPKPQTDMIGNPILIPKTDEYGLPFTDSKRVSILKSFRWRRTKRRSRRLRSPIRCGYPLASLATSSTIHQSSLTVVTAIASNSQQSRSTQPQALIDTMTYVYIGAGLATLLLIIGALIFLILWAQKRKTRHRVNNTDYL